MTVEYPVALRNSRLTLVQQTIDAAGTHGWLRLLDISSNVLSNIPLAVPPCGTVANGVLTFIGTPFTDTSAALGGTAVSAIIYDGNNNVVVSQLTVGTPATAGDIILSPNNIIVANQILSINSATITER
jgi:hypothetical protein